MSRAIELYINAEKKLNANVDFYSASTYATLGIDIDLYTPIFAISRIAGWAAHVIEQLDDNRLIRPRAEYIGPEYPSPGFPSKSADAVYGPGYYVATILGSENVGQAVATGDRGTALQIEFHREQLGVRGGQSFWRCRGQ
jgi:hypothetical protein